MGILLLHDDFCTGGWKKRTIFTFLRLLLSSLTAVARGCVFLTFIGSICLDLKHETLFVCSDLNAMALGTDIVQ